MSNWLTGSIDEGTVADVPRNLRATQRLRLSAWFSEEHINILHERALCAQRKWVDSYKYIGRTSI